MVGRLDKSLAKLLHLVQIPSLQILPLSVGGIYPAATAPAFAASTTNCAAVEMPLMASRG
ncbi:hypothetical protein BH11PSE8_BH11PSE8_11040 [soil metagenome]